MEDLVTEEPVMEEPDFNSMSESDWKKQAEEDERAFSAVLNGQQEGTTLPDQDTLFDSERPLDLGVKADDAQDFEDISDDDLPEEEEASGDKIDDAPGLTDDATGNDEYDDDDLFGDSGRASSPFDFEDPTQSSAGQEPRVGSGLTLPSIAPEPEVVDLRALNFPDQFAADEEDGMPKGEAEINAYLAENWPTYEKDAILNFNQLFPPQLSHFVGRSSDKLPKPLHPTKVSLNIAADQEKAFRSVGAAQSDKYTRIAEEEAKGLVSIVEDSEDGGDSDDEFDYAPITDKVGGKSMLDLDIICADFEMVDIPAPTPAPIEEDVQDEWEREFLGPTKKRKADFEFLFKPRIPMPNFDNYERMTAQTAKRVVLDLNDPHLLVEVAEVDRTAKRRCTGLNKRAPKDVKAALNQRFNISNDEAYSHLKNNHGKVRATVGNISVEHSLPAQKLAWPYYQVKLNDHQARTYHRPQLQVGKFLHQNITFSKPGMRKKRDMRTLTAEQAFKETKDLSLADHYATATLVEYSEEYPTVLSNFGMGNRIINYYRRKDADDQKEPAKFEDRVGDTTILLPEDKSPFAIFGTVDPGETVRTIHNAMYRAPIFKHEPKNTDFLVIRSSTGVGGSSWHIRHIDNLFVAGQQLPSLEIPGPHARRVTNAAKHRMKMVTWRKMRHSQRAEVSLKEITEHVADSTESQNRQKLKEFLIYDKTTKTYTAKPGEGPLDEIYVRTLVKPEEVCALDAMQVGACHLLDAGYTLDKEDMDDGDPGNQSLEQKLTPWNTTKAFCEAAAEKAMLELHGAGDPTGCGLGISMIKTSMKGGYLEGIKEGDVPAAKQALDRKANGGHQYNVRVQQDLYGGAIQRIWNGQMETLSDPKEPDDMDVDMPAGEEVATADRTPQSMATPAFNDNESSFSDDSQQRVLKISRWTKNKFGQDQEVTEVIRDQKVINMYLKRRIEIDMAGVNVLDWVPTGDPETDEIMKARHVLVKPVSIKAELERLNRNKDRRHHRNALKSGITKGGKPSKSKGLKSAASGMLSPSSTLAPSIEKAAGTTRKCANCGQAGHIKTNKKLCPMLNGTMKPDERPASNSGFGNGDFGAGGGFGDGGFGAPQPSAFA
ncbi:related to transcription initiation factor IID 250K chain splice form 2 [Rhynchosporium graminicola]|uniref:Related to transcription initiation factor IID 250K chain splice form 2 n=1 Tax=Rhynchosporium graminicola TaxID=2792576 RepID=A0A1E1L1Z4_9HELO|nr:related to transcription initiation factor IID 250K chain splice form 2 [Rhynchosporium commune]